MSLQAGRRARDQSWPSGELAALRSRVVRLWAGGRRFDYRPDRREPDPRAPMRWVTVSLRGVR